LGLASLIARVNSIFISSSWMSICATLICLVSNSQRWMAGTPDTAPVGGLTVVSFPNNHLQYAITWFILAAMVAGAYIFLMRRDPEDSAE
jgi:cytochrome oxidase assembly protein ShyY1